MCTTYNTVVGSNYIYIYIIQCARHFFEITFIKYDLIKKSNNIKSLEATKTEGIDNIDN